jgi:hypothetical protein
VERGVEYYRAAAAMYRQFLGWPAYACDTLVWMVPGTGADAVIVGAAEADAVVAGLDRPPPVVDLPGSPAYRTLLTLPPPGGRHRRTENLILLPPSRHPRHPEPLRWRHPPTSPLPHHDAVAALLDPG